MLPLSISPVPMFLFHIHKAIIQKIADERRRRAQDVRRSWPNAQQHPAPSPSSPETTSPNTFQHHRSTPGGHASFATAATGQCYSEAVDPSANQRLSPSSGGAPSSVNSAYRRVAWGKGSEVEPSPNDTGTSTSGAYPTSTSEEFPFPSSTHGQSRGHYAGEGQNDDNGSDRPFEDSENPLPAAHGEERFPGDQNQQRQQRQQQRRRLAPSVQRRLALRATGSGRARFSRRRVYNAAAADNTIDVNADDKSNAGRNRASVGSSPVSYNPSEAGTNGRRTPAAGRGTASSAAQDRHRMAASIGSGSLRNSLSPGRRRTAQGEVRTSPVGRGRERWSHPPSKMQHRDDYPAMGGWLSARRGERSMWADEEAEWGTGGSVEEEKQYQMEGSGEGGREFVNKRAVDGEAYRFRSFSEEV